VLRPLEDWERGFSAVLAPLDAETSSDAQVARLCEIARMDEVIARAALAARSPLPVVRAASRSEAELVVRLLGVVGLAAEVVADEDLALGTLARRVRSVEFDADALRLDVLWGERVTLPRADIVCVVEGRVVSSTVEVLESTGAARGGQRDLVETSEFFAETYSLDVYGPTLDASFRVKASAFDFGCLGGRPASNVETNFSRLCEAFASYVGRSRYDADYGAYTRILDHAWPANARVASRGIARRGATIKKFSASLVERDALAQFTRYSRLRYVTMRR
jgi:hypothetical protein